MPIEFARISRDERLTLVIHPGSLSQRTYWALMNEYDDPEAARKNLQDREGCFAKDIHSLAANGEEHGRIDQRVAEKFRKWLQTHPSLEAAIWTGLTTNWPDKRCGKQFTRKDAVAYLTELEAERDQAKATYDRAREYVRNAPKHIQTPVRKIMQTKEGWEDAKLPSLLFETEEKRHRE